MNNSFSIINYYGEDLTQKKYITNPAISRDEELKKLMMVLLTPEKSALLIGKAGVGKTAIVEGLAYRILNNAVPFPLQGHRVIKVNSSSLVGKINYNGREEMIATLLMQELKNVSNTILFIDEIHTLISKDGNSMDLANILKPAIDRGAIKLIGATTDTEYNTYVIRDRAFLRRFEKIEVPEPSKEATIEILFKSLPKIYEQTGITFKYNEYVTKLLLESIVSATSEYKRVYGLSAMYPDIAFSVLTAALSQALFNNKKFVTLIDVYNAIKTSKRIYPDSIVKELNAFREKFQKLALEENITLPIVDIKDIETGVE